MRVPVDFNWPLGEAWFGDELPSIECELCNGTGKKWSTDGATSKGECELCDGEGEIYLNLPLPEGDGWQMWETFSGTGSAISPVFSTPEDLARWLADPGDTKLSSKTPSFVKWWTSKTATYEQWLAVITGPGSACSHVVTKDGILSGVQHEGDELIAKKSDRVLPVEIRA